jgi:hypothetical protein
MSVDGCEFWGSRGLRGESAGILLVVHTIRLIGLFSSIRRKAHEAEQQTPAG